MCCPDDAFKWCKENGKPIFPNLFASALLFFLLQEFYQMEAK